MLPNQEMFTFITQWCTCGAQVKSSDTTPYLLNGSTTKCENTNEILESLENVILVTFWFN